MPVVEPQALPQTQQLQRYIACGMYALDEQLRSDWQALFDTFNQLYAGPLDIRDELSFGTDAATLGGAGLFLGHTCGYPLMQGLQQNLEPVCVAIFDVEGSIGKSYSSRIIVAGDSEFQSLDDCYQGIVAINGQDSNSGMNLLRHAVSKTGLQPPFFSRLKETGSHLNSLLAVAEGEADIAAIDCVSFQLIADNWPKHSERVRTIGFSASTTGLPFVMPRILLAQTSKLELCDTLNRALALLPAEVVSRLHLGGFETVELTDYDSILELEVEAQQVGHARLA